MQYNNYNFFHYHSCLTLQINRHIYQINCLHNSLFFSSQFSLCMYRYLLEYRQDNHVDYISNNNRDKDCYETYII